MNKILAERKIAISVLVFSAAIYIGILVAYSNSQYPLVGGDYSYYAPHLLDEHLFFKLNGPAIQWYTPTFGGGTPAYPNPQDAQFTLPRLYMFIVEPWQAIMAAMATYVAAGFLAAYYFFVRILKFGPLSSAMGAILFNVNGFMLVRVVAVHVGYHAFPLLAVLLVAMTHPSWPSIIKGAIVAVILAVLVHSGGFYMGLVFTLSLLIAMPILLLIRADLLPLKRLIPTSIWALLLTFLLVGSKLYAINSFMTWFPRLEQEHFDASLLAGLVSIFFQLFGVTTILPIFKIIGISLLGYVGFTQNLSGAFYYGLWEFDNSVSPVFIPLIGVGLFLFRSNWNTIRKQFNWKKAGLLLISIVGLWLTTELRLTQGLVYPFLQDLPVLKSLHVNLRYATVYIFPLAVMGAWIFELAQAQFSELKRAIILCVLAGVTLAALLSYGLIGPEWFYINYDARNAVTVYEGIEQGNTYPINEVKLNDTPSTDVLLMDNATDLNPYDPIFGYRLEYFYVELHPGSVWDERDGYFNMTNPAGLVYPAENGSYNFERIRVSDRAQMEAFVNHRQVNWVLPPLQHLLDFLMVAGFVFVLLLLPGHFGLKIIRTARAYLPPVHLNRPT